ncbi:type VI secretion system lipoprotein TssJ [Pseudomonas sp. CAN2814]|jgi:type VI secretion system protein VasD|uniref:type VI secretion system lipoprotein TssJ n=1 Tax=Pseudomonas sp. CAN1 TaxID=3046726 RepID=UPI00264730EF|nr:type VI secretion system lipoprotein TssJ [Pseudomonas sp. CAN1]MDN6859262.1 type VI secretion system lipoprotein TssJ [Pseudomonas sp. CAN1]
MIRQVLLAAGLALLCNGCSSDAASPAPAPEEGTRVTLQLQADSRLNPTPEGYSAPVRVRLLELRSAAGFERADYFSLAEHAATVLGNDLIAQDEWLLQPGEQRELTRHLDPATRQLALMVGYRDLDRAQWRSVLQPVAGQAASYRIELGANAVHAVALEQPSRPDSR